MSSWASGEFMEWAEQALGQYPLHAPTLHFLGHSDNVTFRVEEPDGRLFLLRLHRPALNYWNGIRQLPEVIASELTWLEALSWEGFFPVQQPVRTNAGEWIANVMLEDETSLPATLLTWQEGVHFSPGAPEATAQVERLGALVARLHDFSARWSPPAGFFRPQYDLDHFRRIFARLLRGVDLGVFSDDLNWTLRAAAQVILNQIEALPLTSEYWGMIHADLHVGNFLVRDDEIIPIDFSFCGFGHYLFDLSVCLAGGQNATLRPAFLRGYRSVRALGEDQLRTVDAYALAGMLTYFAYQIDNPTERSFLQRRIPEITKNEVTRFLQGRPVMLPE